MLAECHSVTCGKFENCRPMHLSTFIVSRLIIILYSRRVVLLEIVICIRAVELNNLPVLSTEN
jgi:hypothetical protein